MFQFIGVILAFSIIIILRLKNIDFSITLFVASAFLCLTAADPLNALIKAAGKTVTDIKTFDLCTAVALITVLGYSLEETGLMTETIESLRGFLSSRVLLSSIPALFGLLSMPGGALISAPFNEPEAELQGLKPEQKTYINVWFRHVWYWASPISPRPILAASLAGIALMDFLKVQFPLFAVTIIIGLIVSKNFIKDGGKVGGASNYFDAAKGLTPIIVAVILSVVGTPIWASLIVSIIIVLILKRSPLKGSLRMLWLGVRWDTVISVLAVLFFREVIDVTGSMSALLGDITEGGIPLIALVIFIPILVGALSGTSTMSIGMVFPMMIPMFKTTDIHLISLVYAGALAGYLVSPMHLCLTLTNSYYKSNLRKVYEYLIPSTIVLYIVNVVYHLIIVNHYNGF